MNAPTPLHVPGSTRPTVGASWSRLLLLLALPFYLAYALLTPPFQTPDEQQHLFRSWQLSQGTLIGERRGAEAGGVLPGGLAAAALPEIGSTDPHVIRKLPPPRAEWMERSTAPDAQPPTFTNFIGAVLYSPAGYGPQIGAVGIGRAAGWSVETIVLAGRIGNVLLFLGLFAAALRLAPWGRPAFLFVALLPTTVAAVAGFGQDGFVIGLSALLVALALRATGGRAWTAGHRLVAALAAGGLVLTKFVYLPLLFAAAPLGRAVRPEGTRQLATLLIIAAAAALLLATWLYAAAEVRLPPIGDVPPSDQRIAALLADPSEFLRALHGTYVREGLAIIDGAFTFGWLNVGPVLPAFLFSLAAFAALMLGGDQRGRPPGPWQRGWLALVAIGTILLTSLAVWLYYTPADFGKIRGFQPRYLLPPLLLLLPALLPLRLRWERAPAAMVMLLALANLTCLIRIGMAFYAI